MNMAMGMGYEYYFLCMRLSVLVFSHYGSMKCNDSRSTEMLQEKGGYIAASWGHSVSPSLTLLKRCTQTHLFVCVCVCVSGMCVCVCVCVLCVWCVCVCVWYVCVCGMCVCACVCMRECCGCVCVCGCGRWEEDTSDPRSH